MRQRKYFLKTLLVLSLALTGTGMVLAQTAPTQSYPTGGATVWENPVNLNWSHVYTDETDLQVSLNSNFSSPLVDQTLSASTYNYSLSVNGGTTYYWRIRARNGSNTSDWVFTSFVTQGSSSTTFTITASAGSGGTISPSGSVSVTSGGSQTFTITANSGFSISDVTVDGNSVGAVGTYSFSNVTANHTIAASFTSGGSNFTITASAGTGGTISPSGSVSVTSGGSQTFTITANSGFSISDVTVDGSSVGAVGTHTFSNVTANHTIAASFTGSGTGVPTKPALVSPSNGANGLNYNTGNINLSWDASTGTTPITYKVEYGTDSTTALTIAGNNLPGTSQVINSTLTADTKYFWKVTATNSIGSNASFFSSFYTANSVDDPPDPTVPVLTSPSNGATDIGLTPTLSWNASTGTTPIFYDVLINTNVTFTGTSVFTALNLSGLSQIVTPALTANTVYFWRVKAHNSIGNSISTTFSFTTSPSAIVGPTAPVLVSPSNNATGVAVQPTLSWNASTGNSPIFYDVFVNTNVTFTGTPVFTAINLSGLSQIVTPALSANTDYFWKITARNAEGSNTSSVFKFTVIGPQPQVTITSTSALTSGVSFNASVSITLNGADPSKAYQGTITYDPAKLHFNGSGAGTILSSDGINTTWSAPTLIESPTGTIKFINFSGTDAISLDSGFPLLILNFTITSFSSGSTSITPSNFTGTSTNVIFGSHTAGTITWNAGPVTTFPVLVSPSNNATGVADQPTLSWNASTSTGNSPIFYDVFVNTNVTFTGTPVFTAINLSGLSQIVTPALSANTDYFWKVFAHNVEGSNTSSVFKFTVIGPPVPQPQVTIASTPGLTSGVSFSASVSITLNGADPSKAYQGTITYDPAKLHFNGSSAGTILSSDGINTTWSAPNLTESPTGTINFITFSGTDAISLDSGFPLLRLGFTIISSSSGSTPITPSNFTGTSPNVTFGSHAAGTITWVGGPVYLSLGDVDLDGLIDMNDVIYLSTHLDGGGTPLTDPSQARTNADIRISPASELNVINANDLSDLVTRVITGSFPPAPPSVAPGGDLEILAGNVSQSGEVKLPITVANASNLNNAEIIFTYDPKVISYQTFAANLKVSGYFSNATELKPGKASFIFVTGKTANGNIDLGSIVLKSNDGSIPTGAVITTEYRFNAGQLQTGPTIKFGVTGVESENTIPTKFEVSQNYPNPFNPSTIIKFGLPEVSFVSIKIYNMLGQEVKALVSGEMNAGTYNVQWNGDNSFGHKVSSGTYIYRIIAGSFVETKKMVLLK